MHGLTSLFAGANSPLTNSMTRNARRLAQALIKEYAHEEEFEVSFQEDDLLASIAKVLREDFGCEVAEDAFKHGLRVQVHSASLRAGPKP